MKNLYLTLVILTLTLTTFAQVTDLTIRAGADIWKVGFTASSLQVNCGLCPSIAAKSSEAQTIINELQDSVYVVGYTRTGISISIGASVFHPAVRAEIQISPSMRNLGAEGDNSGRYVNRNVSGFIGVNPLIFSEYAGRYYLGDAQTFFLDFTDAGIYAQFSADGGFEEFVRSTNNLAVLARFQPTLWDSDQKRIGLSIRSGLRMWLLGNSKTDGPFLSANGLPKKVKPHTDWFLGLALKVTLF
ncbi:MAG: hypothetical protein KDE26_13530 [Bacteroidetes bacterium]|nr:hypothetical protein [Bacteroidota bacterium]